METLRQQVEVLITKAAETKQSGEALQFSQAAQNAAHAILTLRQEENLKRGQS